MHRLCLHPQSAMEVFVLFLWTQMEFVWVFLSPACRTDLLYRRLQKRFFVLQEWLCQHPEYDALALADKVKVGFASFYTLHSFIPPHHIVEHVLNVASMKMSLPKLLRCVTPARQKLLSYITN